MGMIKGQREYLKWQKGDKLTHKESILANCYMCNGYKDSNKDCLGETSCPLYVPYTHTLLMAPRS